MAGMGTPRFPRAGASKRKASLPRMGSQTVKVDRVTDAARLFRYWMDRPLPPQFSAPELRHSVWL